MLSSLLESRGSFEFKRAQMGLLLKRAHEVKSAQFAQMGLKCEKRHEKESENLCKSEGK